ncbi:hypothetical protein ACRXCV_00245 (plasmid) [Halobacteriovorax sp. GFR7]|uniref:hypothetical protein n=1 Tax=unclassified Halobacteriovorax TaxID=2639665 RepID=UPI003D975229
MPKSSKKRKNGKVKKANGAGSVDNVRSTAPKQKWTPPEYDITAEAKKLRKALEEQKALVLPTPEEIKMASMLYGVINPDTIRAAKSVLKDVHVWAEDAVADLTNDKN